MHHDPPSTTLPVLVAHKRLNQDAQRHAQFRKNMVAERRLHGAKHMTLDNGSLTGKEDAFWIKHISQVCKADPQQFATTLEGKPGFLIAMICAFKQFTDHRLFELHCLVRQSVRGSDSEGIAPQTLLIA